MYMQKDELFWITLFQTCEVGSFYKPSLEKNWIVNTF